MLGSILEVSIKKTILTHVGLFGTTPMSKGFTYILVKKKDKCEEYICILIEVLLYQVIPRTCNLFPYHSLNQVLLK